jgi:PIN domain nuclease of toxin-antitoxin system
MPVVLDACAVIAYLRDEGGADIVESALMESDCVIHAVNLCEVYKDCLARGETQQQADEMVNDLYSIGLVSREDMDSIFWKFAGQLKAKYRRISLADCFALALASRAGGQLFSSDHHEFDPIVDDGICQITFIR